jgi:transcriptional repressor NrdR
MVCTLCDSDTKITNSRYRPKNAQTWRRHTCPRCNSVFTTKESVETTISYRISDPEANLEPLIRDELFLMIHEALDHRKTAVVDASALTDTVLGQIIAQKQLIITKTVVTDVIAKTLQRFDRVAYIKFKSKIDYALKAIS